MSHLIAYYWDNILKGFSEVAILRSNFPLHHIFHPDILPQTLLTAILEYEELTNRRFFEMEDKFDHGFIKNHFESPQYGESTFSDSGHVICIKMIVWKIVIFLDRPRSYGALFYGKH